MWNKWDEKIVRQDFKHLADIGCNMLRVFPNWRDFQPIEILYGWTRMRNRIRFRGEPLPDTPCGRAGVDEEMIRRFRVMAGIAEENGIELIVSIVTGWMSGTLFEPPALQGRDLYADPLALKWQIRFIRCFVRELKDCPAIKYWELGNESNCMCKCDDPDVAWNWTHTVCSAIRQEDPTRPVASGMHSLVPAEDTLLMETPFWSIETQGELCDLVTAHPYPHSPSKYSARTDRHTSLRLAMQASVEMLLYSDIGNRPGAVEEIGTFSPTYCADKEKAEFLRRSISNSWAHGSEFFLWWCAFDQDKLDFPPYVFSAWERQLGLFRSDFSRKPAAEKIREFREFERTLPFGKLPPFKRNAICLMTQGHDRDHFMGNAWSSFILAKLTGFDVRFRYCMDGGLEDAALYLVPGLCGASCLEKAQYMQLLEKVREGATAYFSWEEASLSPFDEIFGVEVAGQESREEPAEFTFAGETYRIRANRRLILRSIGAEVLACEKNGNPVFIRNRYGKGTIYLLTLPFEFDLCSRPGVFEAGSAEKVRKIYQAFAGPALAERHLFSEDPLITLTEHFDGSTWWCVAVNNGQEAKTPRFTPAENWRIDTPAAQMEPGTALVIRMRQENAQKQEK